MDQSHKIPLWLKIVYSAFVAVLVPFYWFTYSPWNFLFFCDIALLLRTWHSGRKTLCWPACPQWDSPSRSSSGASIS